MDFQLSFSIPSSSFQLIHGQKTLLLGSCFSDSMTPCFENQGFEVESNPFGTIFHPDALANCIDAALSKKESVDVIQRDDLFFSWDSAGRIYGTSEADLIDLVLNLRRKTHTFLSSADFLIVTFGTAWGYQHNELNTIVGNCHKANGNEFRKEFMDDAAALVRWQKIVEQLHALNPKLNIIFTVSPVRHIKDGVIENNRSKAKLISLTDQLSKMDRCEYFPSYEIVIDELRDYRFFKSDHVHPTDEAIGYVWERFLQTYTSDETRKLATLVLNLRRSLEHRSIQPESAAAKKHHVEAEEMKKRLLEKHPEIYWK